jgi:hypothetical protein
MINLKMNECSTFLGDISTDSISPVTKIILFRDSWQYQNAYDLLN